MEVSSLQFILGIFLLAASVIATVFILRRWMTWHVQKSIRAGGPAGCDILRNRTKYPEADVQRFSGQLSLFGFVIAIGFGLLAMSWTQHRPPVYLPDTAEIDDWQMQVIPQTVFPAPSKPPKRLPAHIELAESIPTETSPEFLPVVVEFVEQEGVEMKISESTVLPEPPPQIRQPEDATPDFILRAEVMPRFPGCEEFEGPISEQNACAEAKLLEYIYSQVKYPSLAKETGISGSVVVQFIVEKDGSIGNATIVREIGGGCGDEVLRVVRGMNEMTGKWKPGRQAGTPVRVMFTLPVRFNLIK